MSEYIDMYKTTFVVEEVYRKKYKMFTELIKG